MTDADRWAARIDKIADVTFSAPAPPPPTDREVILAALERRAPRRPDAVVDPEFSSAVRAFAATRTGRTT